MKVTDENRSMNIITGILIFGLVAGGSFYHLTSVQETDVSVAVMDSAVIGLILGIIAYQLVDVVLAKGMIQFRYRNIRIMLLLLLAHGVIWRLMFDGRVQDDAVTATAIGTAEIVFCCLLMAVAGIYDIRYKNEKYIRNHSNELPVRYLKKRWIKTLIELVFRLFPHPEPVGLYMIGSPDDTSPVYVTGNFELTIRRVVKSLMRQNCWLLVCDSRGINIWCSTEAGHFGTEEICESILESGLSDKVKHRKVMLPQLAASNADIVEIQRETGFKCDFGPVRCKDIPEYLTYKENRMMNGADKSEILDMECRLRHVRFDLPDRIEVAVSSPLIFVLVLLLIYNFIGLEHLAVILPLVYILNILHAVAYPYRFVRNIWIWSLTVGVIMFAASHLLLNWALQMEAFRYYLPVSLGMAYLVLEFEGWSPMVKFSYGFDKKVEVGVEEDKCIGCGLCVDVCVKSVFMLNDGVSEVSDGDACMQCRACYLRCPTGAVWHTLKVEENQE